MEHIPGLQTRHQAIDRAFAAVAESLPLDLTEEAGDRILLDLSAIEHDVERFRDTVDVLLKHLTAA